MVPARGIDRGGGDGTRNRTCATKTISTQRETPTTEGIVNRPAQSPDKVSDQLHPAVHKAAAGLLIWFVVAAWMLFGGAGYIDLALAIVSVLVFMALAIPAALRRAFVVAQRGEAADPAKEPSETFGAWLQGRFATWTDQAESSTASMEVLLPLAAVAFGITAMGIVFQVTRAGVG
jgi:hypothetical protein